MYNKCKENSSHSRQLLLSVLTLVKNHGKKYIVKFDYYFPNKKTITGRGRDDAQVSNHVYLAFSFLSKLNSILLIKQSELLTLRLSRLNCYMNLLRKSLRMHPNTRTKRTIRKWQSTTMVLARQLKKWKNTSAKKAFLKGKYAF